MPPAGRQPKSTAYRGRIAPTPTGPLHLGHARTFWIAQQQTRRHGGTLIFRMEDLDATRCRPEYHQAALRDLHWFGLRWQEGPDTGGPHAPYIQSQRRGWYRQVWDRLHRTGSIYPSPHSRKDVADALRAPHGPPPSGEAVFPPRLRPAPGTGREATGPGEVNWRFRVPDGRVIPFEDALAGSQQFSAGADFGDFLVWRKDGFPAYELAVVADDHAMAITEVVRGEDLLLSTARQILLYEALGWRPPAWCHCPLVRDESGRRLAKRDRARSLEQLREAGADPACLRRELGLEAAFA